MLGAQHPPLFSLQLRVYWEDTDAGGIVFYANYLKFFERARTEWLRSLGIGQRQLQQETGGMFVVSETAVKYHRPARLDDLLLVTAGLQEIGRSSMVIKQTSLLIQEQTDAPSGTTQEKAAPLLCEGTIRIGWVSSQTLRPARMPESVVRVLKSTAGS